MKDLNNNLDRFKELMKGVKTYTPTTLFDLPPSWEKLKEGRCPICGSLLKFPQGKTIALCYGRRHPDKRKFIIKLETLNKVIHR